MSVDWTRLLRGLGVLAWAAFFDYLWLSGHASSYVGPRTTWVVTFGAITLTAVAGIYLAGVRSRRPARPPGAAEIGRLGIILVPVLLAAMAPAVSLGAQAVGKKRNAEGKAAVARLGDGNGLRLYELAAAQTNPEWAAEQGIVPGLGVDIDGFVSKTERDGTIVLSRFLATCCAADAVPYSLHVTPSVAVRYQRNQWIRVRGTVQHSARYQLYVTADSVEATERPANPYG